MPEQQRLAGSNFSYFCFPLNDFLEVQKRLGFETIELFGGSPQLWIDAYEHEDGKKIQKKIKEAGLLNAILGSWVRMKWKEWRLEAWGSSIPVHV